MSFRRRITIASAAAVAVAIVLASLLTYLLSSDQLQRQVDTQLRNRGHAAIRLERFLRPGIAPPTSLSATERLALDLNGIAGDNGKDAGEAKTGAGGGSPSSRRGAGGRFPPKVSYGAGAANLFGRLPPGPGQVRGYQQVVNSSGRIVVRSAHNVTLPVDAATLALAGHGGPAFLRDAHVNGLHVRILAESFGKGRVVQLAQPMTEVDSLLSRLRLILALLVLGGVALAALLGRLVAGAAVQPLKRLTAATEHVAATRDLSRRIERVGEDEIGRLAGSFNAMLDALERSVSALDASVHAQRQLVADASHELRTPVTSLRTNVEILQQQAGSMDPEEQRGLLADVVEQIEELTLVINDLIDLARGEEQREDSEELRLDLLVEDVVERTRRHAPATPLLVELEPTLVTGVPARLERAVGNLIDNAVKYSPPGEPVEIALHGTELTVRDHGPGISGEDLPHIFDRFYRGAEARGRPGSGLGLAIVRQVAARQGGSVAAEAAPGGGALMRLRLPFAEPTGSGEEPSPREPVAAGSTGAAPADPR
ncbi:MAG TPA: ATP-binding protein [Solirubrobacteraceae bacterium]|jgi:two-component system sensor histidine kinase MprB